MGNSNFNPLKGSAIQELQQDTPIIQERQNDINKICDAIAKPVAEFKPEHVYDMVRSYKSKYGRWFYSEISNYLFSESNNQNFLLNLNDMQKFAHEKTLGKNVDEQIKVMIDKLWDHSNLAQRQKEMVMSEEKNINLQIDSYLEPYSKKLEDEMNKQLISLIAIFTTLSFLVFGGISSLDNILDGAKEISIIKLAIIGCIWGLCILNLVYVFIFLVSKLTKLSITSDDSPGASIERKYPFLVWSNFVMLLVLSVSYWLYYIDYSDSGFWLIRLSKQHDVLSTIIGAVIIAIFFSVAARLLLGSKKIK